MKNYAAHIIVSIMLAMPVIAIAGTSISFNSINGTFTAQGLSGFENKIQDISDNFGPAYMHAWSIGLPGSYPLGGPVLGKFPSFFAGVSINAGMANMQYFDKSQSTGFEVFPAVALNPSLYAGLGLSEKMDVIFRLMLYSEGFYKPQLEMKQVGLDKFTLYSLGGMVRYRILDEVILLPGIMKFSGLSVAGSFDAMYGITKLSGTQSLNIGNLEVDPDGAGALPAKSYPLTYTPDYELTMKWWMLSTGVRALGYLDFYWIFTGYTGLGLFGSYGSLNMSIDGVGDVNGDATYVSDGGSNPIGEITIDSSNKYPPYYLVPAYIVGLDVNLFVARLSIETMVNLYNLSDVNLQIGTRVQF